MFPDYDQTRLLVADRRNRFEAAARRRRSLLDIRRRNSDGSTISAGRSTATVAAIGAAARITSASLGRTPGDADRAA